MDPRAITRRELVSDVARLAAAGVFVTELSWLASLGGCISDARTHASLSPTEVETLRAFAAQVIPSDVGVIGAVEAGAVDFVARALELPPSADNAPSIRAGLRDLDERARKAHGRTFARLEADHQIALLQSVEQQPFFAATRDLIVTGTFADPSHGGNRNASGWAMLGISYRATYSSPYGWYDATATNTVGRS